MKFIGDKEQGRKGETGERLANHPKERAVKAGEQLAVRVRKRREGHRRYQVLSQMNICQERLGHSAAGQQAGPGEAAFNSAHMKR